MDAAGPSHPAAASRLPPRAVRARAPLIFA